MNKPDNMRQKALDARVEIFRDQQLKLNKAFTRGNIDDLPHGIEQGAWDATLALVKKSHPSGLVAREEHANRVLIAQALMDAKKDQLEADATVLENLAENAKIRFNKNKLATFWPMVIEAFSGAAKAIRKGGE